MQNLQPVFHVLEGVVGIDAEPYEVRGIELEAEAPVGDEGE